MNFDEQHPTPREHSGGTYTTGRSEQEPVQNMGSYVALSLLLAISIILFSVIGFLVKNYRANAAPPQPTPTPDALASSEALSIPQVNTPDCIVDFTYNGTSYCGFLFQPYAFDLPSGHYILTSSDIFSDDKADALSNPLTVMAADGKAYTAYFHEKNSALGVAILMIHGDSLPTAAALSGLNFSTQEEAFLFSNRHTTEKHPVQYEELSVDDARMYNSRTFLELDSPQEELTPGSPIFNDAGDVIAIVVNPNNILSERTPASSYAISIADVNDWVWDTLQNPLRFIGIHGKIITPRNRAEGMENAGFLVNYVEPTKEYNLTYGLEAGDLILGYSEYYSLIKPYALSDIEALDGLYNRFTDGKFVALSVVSSENRPTSLFLLHNTKR